MTDEQIKEILKNSKTIAMVGVSSEKKGEDPKNLKRKPANIVMKYMQDFGYKVIPVNPFAKGELINGETVVESLDKIYEKIDIVDIFRPSKETPEFAKEAIKNKADYIAFGSFGPSKTKKVKFKAKTNLLKKAKKLTTASGK